MCAPAVKRPETEHELPEFERLGEVVVGAQLEAGCLVIEPVGGSEHEDRHAAAGRDDDFRDLIPGRPGDVPVQDGDVVGVDAQQRKPRVAVGGDVGRDGFQAKAVANGLGHEGLVLDEQHAHTLKARDRPVLPTYGKTRTCGQHRAALDGGMPSAERAREPARRVRIRRTRVAGLLLFVAALALVLGQLSRPSPSPTDLSTSVAAPIITALRERPQVPGTDRSEPPGRLGEADGAVPDGTTVFDDQVPGVANLDPGLLGALRRAAADAASSGVRFTVNSGWRSPAYEEHLREQAIARYGSAEAAARWVATGDTSAHVSGDAVDIGPPPAAAWLSARGAAYGLCQIYGNEAWHYELRPQAIQGGCPEMYADPTQDPRIQPR